MSFFLLDIPWRVGKPMCSNRAFNHWKLSAFLSCGVNEFKAIVISKSHSKTVLRTNEVFIWMQFYGYKQCGYSSRGFFLSLEKCRSSFAFLRHCRFILYAPFANLLTRWSLTAKHTSSVHFHTPRYVIRRGSNAPASWFLTNGSPGCFNGNTLFFSFVTKITRYLYWVRLKIIHT